MSIGFTLPGSQPRAATRGKAKSDVEPSEKRSGRLGFEISERYPAGVLYLDGTPLAPSSIVEIPSAHLCSLLVHIQASTKNDLLKFAADFMRSQRAGEAAPAMRQEQKDDLAAVLRSLEQHLAKPRIIDKVIVRERLPGDDPDKPSGRPIGVRETDITQ
jgi:hypothetical protein